MSYKKNNHQINIIWDIDDLPINYPLEVKDTYRKIYYQNRKNYTNWVDKIGKKFSSDIDWWMTLPSYRNPYAGKLLNYLTVLDTIQKLKKKEIILKTKSPNFVSVVKANFGRSNIKAETYSKKESFGSMTLKYIKSLIFQVFLYIFISIFQKKEEINGKKIVLIDKFFTFKKKQNLNYFPNLGNIKNIRIIPTIIPTFNLVKLIKILRSLNKNKEKIIFKEQYLKLSDLFFAFSHFFRRKKFLNKIYYYKSINISELVNEEILNYDDFYSINNGLLNYKFFYRLSKNRVNVLKSFNWFENQIIDKGWNLGFRNFFPNQQKNSFGYQDFNKHFNLISNSPSSLEKISKVTPEKIIIISNYFKKITKEFTKNQKIIIGQSERFKNLNSQNQLAFKKRKKILLVLCGIKNIDIELLKLAMEVCLLKKDLKIFIKPHPILDLKDIIPSRDLPKNLIILFEDLNKILKRSLICITAGPSSALLESAYYGAYNILPEVECGAEENLKIFNLNKSNFSVVQNSEELLNKIIFIMKNKGRIKIKKIKNLNSKSKKISSLLN